MTGEGDGSPRELGDSILRPANSAFRGESMGGGLSSLGFRRQRRASAAASRTFAVLKVVRRAGACKI